MNCFICDLNCNPDEASGAYISRTISTNSVQYSDIIVKLIGKSFLVTIDEEDSLCQTCLTLIEEVDAYYNEIAQMKQIFIQQIHRKYHIDLSDNGNGSILNEFDIKAERSFLKGSNNEFICRKCLFRTNFKDCMRSHFKYHQITDERPKLEIHSRRSNVINEAKEKSVKIESTSEDIINQTFNEEIIVKVSDITDDNRIFSGKTDDIVESLFTEDLDIDFSDNSNDNDNINGSVDLSVEILSIDDNDVIDGNHTSDLTNEVTEIYGKNCLSESLHNYEEVIIINEKNEVPCKKCDKVLYNEKLLIDHMHRKHFICKNCGVQFQTKSKVDYHFSIEHSGKQLTCDQCGKIFKTKNGLKRHYAQHTGNYLYICEFCNRGCTTRKQYLDHRSIHTNEKRYTCSKCGKSFIHDSSYRMHLMYHFNSKPFECTECSKRFASQPHLKVHRIRAHNIGEKLHVCEYCGRKFAAANQLKAHESRHTGVYQYNCNTCKKSFSKRIEYGKHMAKVHQDFSVEVNPKKCEYKITIPPDKNDLNVEPESD